MKIEAGEFFLVVKFEKFLDSSQRTELMKKIVNLYDVDSVACVQAPDDKAYNWKNDKEVTYV